MRSANMSLVGWFEIYTNSKPNPKLVMTGKSGGWRVGKKKTNSYQIVLSSRKDFDRVLELVPKKSFKEQWLKPLIWDKLQTCEN